MELAALPGIEAGLFFHLGVVQGFSFFSPFHCFSLQLRVLNEGELKV